MHKIERNYFEIGIFKKAFYDIIYKEMIERMESNNGTENKEFITILLIGDRIKK